MWVRGLKLVGTDCISSAALSHPMWVRGLKLQGEQHATQVHGVAPYVGAWIETRLLLHLRTNSASHPMWVRGLKHLTRLTSLRREKVAPYVGAWIETNNRHRKWIRVRSRTLCGCVD